MIEDECGCIDYDESGDGPTIVLVPGSCSTGVAWRSIVSHLKNDFRCVTTSLLGYGGTAERRTSLDTDISHEAAILEVVIRRAACPVHLVGHSFGGLTALAVALRKKVPLLSLSILEAPLPELLRSMEEEEHYAAIREMTLAYFAAFHAGDNAAVEKLIDFFGGTGTFAGWPPRVRSYAMETTAVNLLDWASAYGFPLTPASLSNLDVPTLVLWGARSHPAMKRANQLLARCTDASVASIGDAAHFMISTHAPELARVLARHVSLQRAAGCAVADAQ
jgi:pimeloyl-ACP methyl ester carboxylesterase